MVQYLDAILLVGSLILGLAFPAAVGAFSRGQPPRAAMLALFTGGVLILYANASKPGGYSVADLPDVVMRVFNGV